MKSVRMILLMGFLWIHSVVFAAEDCLANHYSIAERPSLQAIHSVDDFYNWRAFEHFNVYSVATIPLAKRAAQNGPSTLAGFDIDDRAWQYDFLSTLWSQGGCGHYKKTTADRTADNVYNFKFWQYLDISYYFGHAFLTVPPTMWTNAAHKNGVLSLGTINFNDSRFDILLDEKHLLQTIDTLLDISKSLGFDGFLINDEQFNTNMNLAIQHLMQTLRNAGLTMIWYDSPPSGGYANYLNEAAIPFFTSAGYFHSNYWWGYPFGSGAPYESMQTLKKYHLEAQNNHVFQMGDVYRNPYKADPFSQCTRDNPNGFFTRFKEIYPDENQSLFYTGLGFYAPNWTMFGGKPNPENDTDVPGTLDFEQSDAAFWEGSGQLGCGHMDFHNVSYFVEPRTVITSLPFYTSFNTGVGQSFFVNGSLISKGAWSHFTLQHILPTWQNVQLNQDRPSARAYFDYQMVYEGGSSFKIVDDHVSPKAATFKLFKTAFETTEHTQLTYIFKTSSNENIKLLLNGTQLVTASKQQFLQNHWQSLTFTFPAILSSIQEIDIVILPNDKGTIDINLGKITIDDSSSLPTPINQIVIPKNDFSLTWLANNPGSTYRIFGRRKDHSTVILNEVANTSYDLRGNIWNGDVDISQFVDYVIQEVTSGGESSFVS